MITTKLTPRPVPIPTHSLQLWHSVAAGEGASSHLESFTSRIKKQSNSNNDFFIPNLTKVTWSEATPTYIN